MPRPSTHLLLCALVCFAGEPAFGGTTAETTTGANIFSMPQEQSVVPTFSAPRDRRGQMRKMLLGDGKDGIPDFKQIMNLPTLTVPQRRAIRETFKAHKAQLGDVQAKLKAMREMRDTAGGAVDMQQRQEFQQLRTQVQELRKSAWEKVKAQLSEQQIKDIQAMRKGELTPATFREGDPMAAQGRMRNGQQ